MKTRERLLSSSCFACLMLLWRYCATYSLGMCRFLRYMVASKINLVELQTTQAKINKPRNKKWIANLSFHGGAWVCMPHAFLDLYHLLRYSLFLSPWGEKPIVLQVSVKWLYVSIADLSTVKVKWTIRCMSTGIHDQSIRTEDIQVQREVSTLPQNVVHNGFKGI